MGEAFAHLRYETHEGVATLTLDRPERRNAYVPELGDELLAALALAREDASVRAVLLAAAGPAFCVGVDLDRLAQARAGEEPPGRKLGEEPFLTRFPLELAALGKPTLCAIHGAAIGVGVTMTLGFDLRIAAEDAVLALPFARLGIVPALGSTHWLPRLVGPAAALDLLLTGRAVAADEALAMGLVNRMVPAGELAVQARETAQALIAAPGPVLAEIKRALAPRVESDLAAALAAESAANARVAAARRAKEA